MRFCEVWLLLECFWDLLDMLTGFHVAWLCLECFHGVAERSVGVLWVPCCQHPESEGYRGHQT